MTNLTNRRVFGATMLALSAAVLTACGGDPTPSATLSVTPALGAVFNAPVSVFDATGTLLGSATTNATTGKATVELFGTVVAPLIVQVELNTSSSYFDEKSGGVITVTTPAKLLSVSPVATTSIGVTPLTNMAAKFAGVTPATIAAKTTVIANDVYSGLAKTVVTLGLPNDFNPLIAPVVAVNSSSAVPAAGTYGNLLYTLAKHATTDALAQAVSLEAAVTSSTTVNATTIDTINAVMRTNVTGITIGTAVTDSNTLVSNASNIEATIKSTVDSDAASGASDSSGGSGGLN